MTAKAFGTMTAALLTQIPISAYSTIIMLHFSLLASQQLALLNFFYPNANLQAFPVLLFYLKVSMPPKSSKEFRLSCLTLAVIIQIQLFDNNLQRAISSLSHFHTFHVSCFCG